MSVLQKGIAIGFEVRMKTTDSYQKSCSHIVLINLTYTHTIYIYIFLLLIHNMARCACELTTKVIKNKNKNKIRTPSHDRYPTSLKKSIGTSRGVCLSREEPTTAAHDADAEPVEAEEETCRLQEGTWKRAR